LPRAALLLKKKAIFAKDGHFTKEGDFIKTVT
jgi:hypothetical protein